MLLAGFLAGSIAIASAADESETTPVKAASEAMAPKAALRARKNIASTPLKREWGIEVLGVHQTSAGYMLQFRYRVIDPKAAKSLFDRKIKPYLVDAATGAKVIVPSPDKVGQLRNVNTPETGRTYWMLFANPAKMIKAGSHVSVHIGDFDSGTLVVN
ncbi:MAG: hypothetical protein WA628_04880 [Terriglobales bacterium]